MSHVRKQIRDAAGTALTGLTQTGGNVFVSSVYDLNEQDLPGLKIYTLNDEPTEFLSNSYPRRVRRELDLVVEGYAKKTKTVDDLLDLIAVDVENAISAENANDDNLGSLTHDLYLDSVLISLAQTDQPVAMIRMIFKAIYNIAENDCETALD